jgi:hypothetical protein
MAKFHFELTSTPITSHVGLAFVGQALQEKKLANHLTSVCPKRRNGGLVSDLDNVKAMIGLLCLGKPHFDAIAEYSDEPWFTMAMGINRLPSPETLRQRIQSLPEKTGQVWRDFTVRLLAADPDLLGEKIHGENRTVIHCDVSPMDNSDTKKEGVCWTYKNYAGYAPMFGYIGPHGLMLNNELRPGSSHSNCAGTADWFDQTLKMAGRVSPHKRLIVADSGNDSAQNLRVFASHEQTDFVVKCNLRKQDPQQWLDMAKQQTGELEYEKIDRGAWAWYGERDMVLAGQEKIPEQERTTQRVVFRATERFAHLDGQCISPYLVSIDAYWTSLDWAPKQVHEFYNQRGTSEQYHSELKSDIGVERLPSGKFAVNQQVLDLAMIAYNLLRLMGQQMLRSRLVPRRKARSGRLRLRTVMQNLMYMAGRVVRHARRTVIRIFKGHGWALPALALARGPDRCVV